MSPRMSADDRREEVLDAATRAFARGGYAGTSTDKVAREAGVSQPYVVRIFGTKLELFLEVLARATERIRTAFQDVLDEAGSDVDQERLGLAYAALLEDHDLLQVMMHGFSNGGVPEIAAAARRCMSSIVATVQRTGWTDEEVCAFVAHGMLINVMLAMRAPQHEGEDPALDALAVATFGDALTFLR